MLVIGTLELQDFTLLFAGVCGSTNLADEIGVSTYHNLINRFYRVNMEVILHTGALIDNWSPSRSSGCTSPGDRRGQLIPQESVNVKALLAYTSYLLLVPKNVLSTRYNCPMHRNFVSRFWLGLILLLVLLVPPGRVLAKVSFVPSAQSGGVTAFDLIIAMNTLRASYGLPVLKEDPIINAVAQATAEIMAANNMSSHIGDVRGRLQAAGYGGGAQVWATENFAVAASFGIDEIMLAWSDPAHMIPAVNPAYCNIGAGVAKAANGRTYYVLQAAYTSAKSCGEYKSVSSGSNTQPGGVTGVSQIIIPVKIATPDAEGRIFHEVKAGQSFWAIAVAYKITINDLEVWNNLARKSKLQIGQILFIPGSNTSGYSTPTPMGMVLVATPDADGRIVHSVQAYHTLITIADAYDVKVETILANNGLQLDWPLQIGQNLVIDLGNTTPSPTPRPLTPIEMLTPASDGRYYHTVSSGETLSWIANYYDVGTNELMAWNGLSSSSIIVPEQKLLLQVTPPATETPVPPPATATSPPTATLTPSPETESALAPASPTAINPDPETAASSAGKRLTGIVILLAVLATGGLIAAGFYKRQKS